MKNRKYFENMNLIDLVSEMHLELRNKVNRIWNENNTEKINHTESHIFGMLAMEPTTVAELSRNLNISRQATHKCVQNLIEREYLYVKTKEAKSKEKIICLTDKGIQCNNEMLRIKNNLEKEIGDKLGESAVEIMKLLLKKEWID